MPIYEYECSDCNHYFDELQKMNDDPLLDCPVCNKPKLKRLLSAPSFRLKGSGWYETDFKGKSSSSENKATDDASKKKEASDTNKPKGGTESKKENCGKWKTIGCDNVFGHPENKKFIKHSKISCFRSKCEYCWLEKWLARESSRTTQRIENYVKVFKNLQFARSPNLQRKYLNPIHVIVSPSWNDKFLSFLIHGNLLNLLCIGL